MFPIQKYQRSQPKLLKSNISTFKRAGKRCHYLDSNDTIGYTFGLLYTHCAAIGTGAKG
ncbi:Hypothetical protein I595_1528 [Croceitalea dokdonensis DOKDO 023]|uniref:Uncharacterized protein n=1 Tax=Croceitalea dokdonensis DOKDO 023 TaxID=1300341 RepID=A0A0P7ATU7_9FLAO|nr:Hypothetical protein I595_1528 [Croceitalea dokdonensis DOKDO 023]